MYHNQDSFSKMSFYSIQPLQPSISNPNPNPNPNDFHYLPSDSSYHHNPPGFDPYPSSASYQPVYAPVEAQPAFYSDPNSVSPRWVVKQAGPVKYSPDTQSSRKEAIASASYNASLNNNWVGQKLVRNFPERKPMRPKMKPKKTNVDQKVRCDLCKIECNNIQLYEKHLAGKKHSKNLEKISGIHTSSSVQTSQKMGTPGGAVVANLEMKKQKLLEGGTSVQSLRLCTVCNVACNGEIAFADHLAGKKHTAQERAQSKAANSNPTSGANPTTKPQEKKAKVSKNDGTARCEVCKISCTSDDGLVIHRQGKKHKKNLEKLQKSITYTSAPSSTATEPPPASSQPATGAEENTEPGEAKATVPESHPVKKEGARPGEPKDVETKKRKILECGAAAGALKTCTICNVVCNSETVFNSHLAGQKHAAMVKQAKARDAAANGPPESVTEDLPLA